MNPETVKTQEQIKAEIIAIKAALFDVENKMRQLVALHKQIGEERKRLFKQLEETIKQVAPERVEETED